MNRKSIKLLVLVLFFQCLAFVAQAQFSVDAQLRSRFHVTDGYQKLPVDTALPTVYVSQRSRLILGYTNEKLRLKFSIQDVRVWGDEQYATTSGVNGNDASIDIYEAYAELKIGNSSCLSIGRQELLYDNQSLLSNSNWNQNGIATNALIFKLDTLGWQLHMGGSWNSSAQTPPTNEYASDRYKTINFLWINRKFGQNQQLSFLQLASGRTQTDTTSHIIFRHTSGLYYEFVSENLILSADAYYQYGKNQEEKDVSAFLFDAEACYKLGNLSPAGGISYLSGNNKVGADLAADHLFEAVYRSRHTFFGFLDYFSKFNTNTKEGGITDYYVYLDYKFSKALSIRNVGHYFQLAQTNATTPLDKNLGYENDLVLKYKFNNWGALEGGYLLFLPTESLKTLQSVPIDKFSQFFYLQLTLSPTLFKQKSETL